MPAEPTHASKQAFKLHKMGHHWTQSAVAAPVRSAYTQWLHAAIGVREQPIGDQQIHLRPGLRILINLHTSTAYHPVLSLWQTSYLSFGGQLIAAKLPGIHTSNSIFFPVLGSVLLGFIQLQMRHRQAHHTLHEHASSIILHFLTCLKP